MRTDGKFIFVFGMEKSSPFFHSSARLNCADRSQENKGREKKSSRHPFQSGSARLDTQNGVPNIDRLQ